MDVTNIIKGIIVALLFLYGLLNFIGGSIRYARSVDYNNRLLANRVGPAGQHEVLAISQLVIGILMLLASLYVANW